MLKSTTRVFLLAALLAPSLALAQPAGGEDEARYHFRLGQTHYENGRFAEAAREFEESYRLSQRAELLHNLYVAYRDAGDLEHAADALRRYLANAQNIENEQFLRQRLTALERTIAERGARETPPEGHETPPGETNPRTPRTQPAAQGGGLSPVGFIVAGVGAAALIAGGITGGLALSAQDQLAAMCPNHECPPEVDFESQASTGRALALTTDVLIPIGIAAVATGVILIFVLQEGAPDNASAGAACGPEGCYAYARGRF